MAVQDNFLRTLADIQRRLQTLEKIYQLIGSDGILNLDGAKINDASILSAKIISLAWDKAQGGTAILGGVGNIDGILSVHDNSDVEKVIVDKDGITVKSGKISIKNDGEEVSIDAKGIVSTVNFVQSDTVNLALNQTISGTSETDVTGASLTFTIARTRLVLVLFSTSNWVNNSAGNTCNLTVRLKRDSTDVGRCINTGTPNGEPEGHTYSNHYIASLPAGTYTIKLTAQLETVTGSPTANVYNYRLSYLILGT